MAESKCVCVPPSLGVDPAHPIFLLQALFQMTAKIKKAIKCFILISGRKYIILKLFLTEFYPGIMGGSRSVMNFRLPGSALEPFVSFFPPNGYTKGLVVVNSDHTMAEFGLALKHEITGKYAGYICLHQDMDTLGMIKLAMEQLKDMDKVSRVYIVTNSDVVVNLKKGQETNSLVNNPLMINYWYEQMLPLQSMDEQMKNRIYFIPPFIPTAYTRESYEQMMNLYLGMLIGMGVRKQNINMWMNYVDLGFCNHTEVMPAPEDATKEATMMFGNCYRGTEATAMGAIQECGLHLEMAEGAAHLNELGAREFIKKVMQAEPDQCLSNLDIRPTLGFVRHDFNLNVKPEHMWERWNKDAYTIPPWLYAFVYDGLPVRKNLSGKHVWWK